LVLQWIQIWKFFFQTWTFKKNFWSKSSLFDWSSNKQNWSGLISKFSWLAWKFGFNCLTLEFENPGLEIFFPKFVIINNVQNQRQIQMPEKRTLWKNDQTLNGKEVEDFDQFGRNLNLIEILPDHKAVNWSQDSRYLKRMTFWSNVGLINLHFIGRHLNPKGNTGKNRMRQRNLEK